ncbi:hypothetical protein GGX14DRAFT_595053 [Mycena pura]|uniref:Uncharacterized protein n=1 Tax=Mycena pura TaxID=153505 RepID=A0AAD6VNY6_9AGAR|nr:hypothetical protein GGX14DRAFT_595053 [Mycena pura]
MEYGTYMMGWRTSRGENCCEGAHCILQSFQHLDEPLCRCRHGPHYARLARFIKSTAAIPGAHTTRTVFGPSASFFSMSERGYCWQNLPQVLEDDMHACLRVRRPTSVALGAQGAYVVLYSDGTVTFDLRGLYPLVEGMIRNTQEAARKRGIMYVALNPHMPGEYYAVFGDGSASWSFPTAWSRDVTTVSREIKPVGLAPAPPPKMSAPGVSVSAGGTGPPPVQVAMGGTGPPPSQSPAPLPLPMQIAAPAPRPAPVPLPPTSPAPSTVSATSSGMHAGASAGGSILAAVGHAVHAAAHPQEASPPAYAPVSPAASVYSAHSLTQSPVQVQTYAPVQQAYAPVQQTYAYAPVHAQTLPPQTTQAPPHPHHMTWQEGLTMGLKAAKGAAKLYNAIEGQPQQQQQAQQGDGGGFDAGSLIGMAMHAIGGDGDQSQNQGQDGQGDQGGGGFDASALYNMAGIGTVLNQVVVVDQGQDQVVVQDTMYVN